MLADVQNCKRNPRRCNIFCSFVLISGKIYWLCIYSWRLRTDCTIYTGEYLVYFPVELVITNFRLIFKYMIMIWWNHWHFYWNFLCKKGGEKLIDLEKESRMNLWYYVLWPFANHWICKDSIHTQLKNVQSNSILKQFVVLRLENFYLSNIWAF